MSRFEFSTTRDSKKVRVAYGLDRICGYFIDVTELQAGEGVFILSRDSTTNNRGQILEFMQEWGVPQQHLEQLALDLPLTPLRKVGSQ